MSKEIIINADKNQTRIALIEDGELAELHIESTENERTLGDIYLGRVRRTMPSIQAAFIDIGQKQDAFLHYSDLADNLPDWLKLLESDKPNVSLLASKNAAKDNQSSSDSAERGRHSRDAKGQKDDAVAADAASDDGGKDDAASRGKSSNGNAQKDDNSKGDRRSSRRGGRRNSSRRSGRGRGSGRNDSDARGGMRPPETYLDKGKRILVKIVKEPISAKGSRVSTDISLAGRFLVLVPLANYVAVSKKIYSYKERRRLRALARSLLPTGFGVIVRTVAEGKKAKELDTDLRLLLDKWRKLEKRLEGSPEPPIVVHEDVSMASSVIRDLFSDDYDRILIDDPKLFKNVKSYVQAVAPHMVPAVQFHKGKRHIFKAAKIAHDVNQAFQSRVDLPSGGYLFIEHTEAMHVVDVNSGRAGRGLSQEQNSLKVDLEAVSAITKQIRLRDLGGIIVIDFIDLREDRNRKKVYHELKKAFSRDRAVTKILPMSDFGLVEITRQRLRPSITKTFSVVDTDKKDAPQKKTASPKKEKAPRSMTIEGFVEKIERWITSYKAKGSSRSVQLQVHPFAAAFLMQKIPAYTTRWLLKYFIRVKLIIDESLDPLGIRFIDPKTGKAFPSRSSGKRRGRGKPRRNADASKKKEEGAARSRADRGDKEKDGESKSGEERSSRSRGGRSRGNRRNSRSRNKSGNRRGRSNRDASNKEASNRDAASEGSSEKNEGRQQRDTRSKSRGSSRGRSDRGRNAGGKSSSKPETGKAESTGNSGGEDNKSREPRQDNRKPEAESRASNRSTGSGRSKGERSSRGNHDDAQQTSGQSDKTPAKSGNDDAVKDPRPENKTAGSGSAGGRGSRSGSDQEASTKQDAPAKDAKPADTRASDARGSAAADATRDGKARNNRDAESRPQKKATGSSRKSKQSSTVNKQAGNVHRTSYQSDDTTSEAKAAESSSAGSQKTNVSEKAGDKDA